MSPILFFIIFAFTTSWGDPIGLVPCDDDQDCFDLQDAICMENFCQCGPETYVCQETNKGVAVNKIGLGCKTSSDCRNILGAECDGEGKCVCMESMVASSDGRKCLRVSRGIGDYCEEGIQCYTKTPSTGCQQNKCVCQQHMHEHNGSCYRNVELGGQCVNDGECTLAANSSCVQSECRCSDGHIRATLFSKCLPLARGINSPCTVDDQCLLVLGKGSECSQGSCQCKELFQQINGTCRRDILLGELCSRHSECHQPGSGPSRLECLLGSCRCKFPYHEEDNYCLNASLRLKPAAMWSCCVMYILYYIF